MSETTTTTEDTMQSYYPTDNLATARLDIIVVALRRGGDPAWTDGCVLYTDASTFTLSMLAGGGAYHTENW